MQLDRPIRVVTPTVDGDVLAALARVDEELTPPRVHGIVGDHSEAGVRKALQRLAGQGIVGSRRAGHAVLYQLNRDHLAAASIIELARLRDTLLDRLRARFAAWPTTARYAALFGTASVGGMDIDSDVDLFIVRPDAVELGESQWRTQLGELESDVRRWLGNDVRVLEYAEAEVLSGLAVGEPVLAAIDRDGIALTGPARYFNTVRDREA